MGETVLKLPGWFTPARRLPVRVSAAQHTGLGMQQSYPLANGAPPMFEYIKTWVELKTDRRAVTALEYALIAGVIVATILAGFQVLASDLSSKFSAIGGSM
jgi:pilus assembly protein Flp/PilA